MYEELVRRIVALERRVDSLKFPEVGVKISTANVSDPPTDAELDSAFDTTPASFYDVGLVDDGGAGANYWLVVSDGTVWLYKEFNKAL